MSARDNVQAALDRMRTRPARRPRAKKQPTGRVKHAKFCPYCPDENNLFLTIYPWQKTCPAHTREKNNEARRMKYAVSPTMQEKKRSDRKKWYSLNKEQRLAYQAQYYESNREKLVDAAVRRERERYQNDPAFREYRKELQRKRRARLRAMERTVLERVLLPDAAPTEGRTEQPREQPEPRRDGSLRQRDAESRSGQET